MWRALVVDPLPRRQLDALAQRFVQCGCAGVQEELPGGAALPVRQPWDDGPDPPPADPIRLRAWFEDPVVAAVEALALAVVPAANLTWEEVVEEDWENSWKSGFPQLMVSDRLIVAPPWDAPPGALIIEPGQGFGTGRHETTRAVLHAIVRLIGDHPHGTALDVGCGSGILALAAAKLGWSAEGIDIDPVAVSDARAQALRNDLDVPFSTTPLASINGTRDMVLANLFAETLISLSVDLMRVTGRWLVMAGILLDRETRVVARFEGQMILQSREVDGEWVMLVWKRRDHP